MRYPKIKAARPLAFMLMVIVCMSGMNLSLNSSARASRSINARTLVPSSLPPTQAGTNGKIAFTSMRDGNAEIYTMNADGSNQVNLTKNPANDSTPVWSPDGTRIAFESNRSGVQNIYVMNADGSNVTKITKYDVDMVDFRVFDPAWSPDGTKLVYVGSLMGEVSSLLVVSADGSGVTTRIDPFSTEVADPEWSPDGTRIAYAARVPCSDCYPNPSLVAFRLFVINADGSGKTQIADSPQFFASSFPLAEGSGPTWSPDGASIAYTYDNTFSSTQQPKRVADIAVVKSSGGGDKFLTENPSEDTYPSWSPDGSRIAFTSNRDGHKEIYLMNSDGSLQARLTNGAADNFDPNWQTLNRQPSPPAASTIQFSVPGARLYESIFFISQPQNDPLVVTRLGDLAHEASVDFTTSSACLNSMDPHCTAMASDRSDYTATAGTLHFAPGEASKGIHVPIIDDSFTEGDEFFYVILSNPVGAQLGGQAVATAVITDNDSPSFTLNPIDGISFFVRQHYLDFLNREPEPGGFDGWRVILTNCASNDTRCDRIEVSSAFFRSPEFQGRGYFIFRFYSAALGRNPFYAEFMPDLRHVSGFQTDAELEASKAAFVNDFVSRAEFKQRYAITDPAAYVDAILTTAGVNLAHRQTLIDDLRAGKKSRAEVLRAIVESLEVYNKCYNTAFVVMQYFGYLRRDPDILYLNWIDTMNKTGDYRTMINGFLNSMEYRRRFAP